MKAAKRKTVMLKGLRWQPAWATRIGCMKGCLDFLGREVSLPWIHGGTGHAFVMNMHEQVCASGPTTWRSEHLGRLLANLGGKENAIFTHREDPAFREKRQVAWSHVRQCLDRKVPCYGWELKVPEYYVVCGYDETGYFISGPHADAEGPVPWDSLAEGEIGCLYLTGVEACDPAPDRKVVRDAVTFAIDHAERPAEYAFPKCKTGPAGFDQWAKALETGTASRFGLGYNGEVWRECRDQAVRFLGEAKARLDDRLAPLLDDAAAQYALSRDELGAVCRAFPFDPHTDAKELVTSEEAAALIREAAKAEREALRGLKEIVAAI